MGQIQVKIGPNRSKMGPIGSKEARRAPQWGNSGETVGIQWPDSTRTHTTGTHPGSAPCHHTPYPGYHYPGHHHLDPLFATVLRPLTTNARTRMSKNPKFTPKGCSEKPLSDVSRALTNMPGLTVSCQARHLSLAREAFLAKKCF